MSHICRQLREFGEHILAIFVPSQKSINGEGMAKIMNTWGNAFWSKDLLGCA